MTDILFLHECLITLYSKKFANLYIKSIQKNEEAIIAINRLYKLILRRIFWYYKKVLEEHKQEIVAIKFLRDKEDNFRHYLVSSKGVLIEFKLNGLSSIAGLFIPEKDLKKGKIVKWEEIKSE